MRNRAISALLLAVLAAPSFVRAADEGIAWEVENRFPLLSLADFDRVKNQWHELPAGDQTMWNFIRRRMDLKENSGSPDEFLLARPPMGRPAAEFADKGQRDLTVLLTVADSDCQWTVEPSPARPPEDGKCQASMTIPVDTPFKVGVNGARTARAFAQVRVREIVIVAMGDSYASGEGSPDRPAIYPADAKTPESNDWFARGLPTAEGSVLPAVWWDPVCHRSMLSWPVLASLRVALQNQHAVVRLVDVACSGAEFLDGFFWSQAKSDFQRDEWGSPLTSHRDGLGRRAIAPEGHYLRRSQVNAVRDALCEPLRPELDSSIDIDLRDHAFQTSMRACVFKRKPDALLLTAGGNDIRFSAAVTGVFVPVEAKRRVLGPIGLALARAAMGTISPNELAANARRWRPLYPSYLLAIQEGVGVKAAQTVLLQYPNPVGSAKSSCTKGLERARVRNAFMTLGVYAHLMAPSLARPFVRGWTVEIDDAELQAFAKAYPAVKKMQHGVGHQVVPWHPEPKKKEFGDNSFSDRLLCESTVADRERQLRREPVFFCSNFPARIDECALHDPQDDPENFFARRELLKQWKFETPGRRMTNSTNDALLAQRSWNRRVPSDAELTYALAGTMHPVTESHAVGADSAYARLAKILDKELVRSAD
jgi:hypothetical protein